MHVTIFIKFNNNYFHIPSTIHKLESHTLKNEKPLTSKQVSQSNNVTNQQQWELWHEDQSCNLINPQLNLII
jgi:hypothetical protein